MLATPAATSEKDRFLTAFYDHYMIWLAEPLMVLTDSCSISSTVEGTRVDCFGGEKDGKS